ncbi:MAG TPA: hypothetical protein VM689_04935 [Aliidongia sp.]|nr:hypothetical protein [Aliidongia sp.]
MTMRKPHRSLVPAVLGAAGLLAAASLQAQTVQTPPEPQHRQMVPQSPPPSPTKPPVEPVQPGLSGELNQSGGVITPPKNVDPSMQKPAPEVGPQSTPVVPPPGTPENRPGVQPK